MAYVGVWEGFTEIQIALLRADFIVRLASNEYEEDKAAALFDLGLLGGFHPDGLSREDLVDELDWMPVDAIDNSVDREIITDSEDVTND